MISLDAIASLAIASNFPFEPSRLCLSALELNVNGWDFRIAICNR